MNFAVASGGGELVVDDERNERRELLRVVLHHAGLDAPLEGIPLVGPIAGTPFGELRDGGPIGEDHELTRVVIRGTRVVGCVLERGEGREHHGIGPSRSDQIPSSVSQLS